MQSGRKPLAKVERHRRLRLSGFTIVWRGTPGLDDWVAYIAKPKAKRLVLVDGAAERKVRTLLSRLQAMSKREVGKLAKG